MVEHGEYTVKVEGEIIIVTFIGMFNEVASQNVCSLVEDLVNEMEGRGFYMLFNTLNYEGSTPEAHKIGNRHFMWIEKQNCLGRATVASKLALIEIARNEQDSLRKSKIISKEFATETEAKNWLLSIKTTK